MNASELTTGLELILNASEGVLQIAVTDNEKLLCYQEWHSPGKASETLTAALEEICARLDIKINQFRRIACAAGPGSFTGIRLVLSTAAAIRRVTGAQLASLDYLQALAATAVIYQNALYPAEVAVLTHARHNLVHFQRFRSYGPQIPPSPLAEASLLTPARALQELGESNAIVCGSGIKRNSEVFATPVTGKGPAEAPNLSIIPYVTTPGVMALCLLARHGDYFPGDLVPVYIRGCDAVENLEKDSASSEKLNILHSLLGRQPTAGSIIINS